MVRSQDLLDFFDDSFSGSLRYQKTDSGFYAMGVGFGISISERDDCFEFDLKIIPPVDYDSSRFLHYANGIGNSSFWDSQGIPEEMLERRDCYDGVLEGVRFYVERGNGVGFRGYFSSESELRVSKALLSTLVAPLLGYERFGDCFNG